MKTITIVCGIAGALFIVGAAILPNLRVKGAKDGTGKYIKKERRNEHWAAFCAGIGCGLLLHAAVSIFTAGGV